MSKSNNDNHNYLNEVAKRILRSMEPFIDQQINEVGAGMHLKWSEAEELVNRPAMAYKLREQARKQYDEEFDTFDDIKDTFRNIAEMNLSFYTATKHELREYTFVLIYHKILKRPLLVRLSKEYCTTVMFSRTGGLLKLPFARVEEEIAKVFEDRKIPNDALQTMMTTFTSADDKTSARCRRQLTKFIMNNTQSSVRPLAFVQSTGENSVNRNNRTGENAWLGWKEFENFKVGVVQYVNTETNRKERAVYYVALSNTDKKYGKPFCYIFKIVSGNEGIINPEGQPNAALEKMISYPQTVGLEYISQYYRRVNLVIGGMTRAKSTFDKVYNFVISQPENVRDEMYQFIRETAAVKNPITDKDFNEAMNNYTNKVTNRSTQKSVKIEKAKDLADISAPQNQSVKNNSILDIADDDDIQTTNPSGYGDLASTSAFDQFSSFDDNDEL